MILQYGFHNILSCNRFLVQNSGNRLRVSVDFGGKLRGIKLTYVEKVLA